MKNRIYAIFFLAVSLIVASSGTSLGSVPANGTLVSIVPGRVVLVSSYGVDALYISGKAYHDLSESKLEVSFTVEGLALSSPMKRNLDGYFITSIEIKPSPSGCGIIVGRLPQARGMAIAVSPASRYIPDTPNVVFTLSYGLGEKAEDASPTREASESSSEREPLETDKDYPRIAISREVEGEYELPPFPYKYKYSDALVSLNVVNTDFRDVLMLLSEIGNISIVLDPYWNEPPTGGRRRPGGPGATGMGGGEAGQGGGQTAGYRGAEIFQIRQPLPGTGTLTLNFENVPFDLALDLILTAVNLEKIEIYPGFFD